MALVKPRELFEDAVKYQYGLGAFNVFSMETVLAVLEAAENQGSPAILQVSMGTRGYVGYLREFVDLIKRLAEKVSVPVFVQHDHCSTVDACREAIEAGVQAVMFDGSHLPYKENERQTRAVAAMAQEQDVWVEAELGCLPGFEDLVFSESAVYTDPIQAKLFVEETGCDALAVAVGTSHGGVKGKDYLPLRFDILEAIVAQRPGYPYVLHGAASLPPELIAACNEQGGEVEYLKNCSEESIAKAVGLGIRKVNMDVDNFLAFTARVRGFLNEKPAIYDPRRYLAQGSQAFREEVEHKMRTVVFSAGRYPGRQAGERA